MSTHNICFRGEIRTISIHVLFEKKKKNHLSKSCAYPTILFTLTCLWIFSLNIFEPELTTKPTIRPVWPAKTDQSEHPPSMARVLHFPLWTVWRLKKAEAISKDSDQTVQMCRLICLRWSLSLIVGFVMGWLILFQHFDVHVYIKNNTFKMIRMKAICFFLVPLSIMYLLYTVWWKNLYKQSLK